MRLLRTFLLNWRLGVAIVVLSVAALGQSILHSGEEFFTISVQGGNGVRFKGNCLTTTGTGESINTKLEGVVPAEFKLPATAVYLTVQNQTGGKIPEMRVGLDGRQVIDMASPNALAGSFLEVTLSKGGRTLKTQRTDAPYGVISIGTVAPATGAPIRTEIQVEGVRFALLTFTSAIGDTEQQLVPVPFNKEFYPREGAIVSLTAQKTRVVRVDPMHFDGRLEILDDGKEGTMLAVIRVNGVVVGSSEAAEAFGVAAVTIRVP